MWLAETTGKHLTISQNTEPSAIAAQTNKDLNWVENTSYRLAKIQKVLNDSIIYFML